MDDGVDGDGDEVVEDRAEGVQGTDAGADRSGGAYDGADRDGADRDGAGDDAAGAL